MAVISPVELSLAAAPDLDRTAIGYRIDSGTGRRGEDAEDTQDRLNENLAAIERQCDGMFNGSAWEG